PPSPWLPASPASENGGGSTASPATCGSGPSLPRSSSGLRSSSSSTKADRSRLDSCSSLMACISCGVITSDWDWRNSNLCVSAMGARYVQNLVRFLLNPVQSPCTRLDACKILGTGAMVTALQHLGGA